MAHVLAVARVTGACLLRPPLASCAFVIRPMLNGFSRVCFVASARVLVRRAVRPLPPPLAIRARPMGMQHATLHPCVGKPAPAPWRLRERGGFALTKRTAHEAGPGRLPQWPQLAVGLAGDGAWSKLVVEWHCTGGVWSALSRPPLLLLVDRHREASNGNTLWHASKWPKMPHDVPKKPWGRLRHVKGFIATTRAVATPLPGN